MVWNFLKANLLKFFKFANYINIPPTTQLDAKKYILEAVELSEDKSKYNALLQKIN